MPLTHTTPVFSVDECAIYPMLTDVAGSAPTYSAKIPVPGINGVTTGSDILNKELFGDNVVLARAAKYRSATLACMYAKLSLDVLAVLSGSTVVDSGTTPNQVATYSVGKTNTPGYFKLEFRVLGVEVPGPAGGGSLNVKFNKCKAIDFSPGIEAEDYGKQSLNVGAIYPNGTAGLVDWILNETAAALSA